MQIPFINAFKLSGLSRKLLVSFSILFFLIISLLGTAIYISTEKYIRQKYELELKNIPRSADLKAGDLLMTSGLGGRFPMGYPVATVTRFSYEEGNPFAKVMARPLAALDRLRYLLLLWPDASVPSGPEHMGMMGVEQALNDGESK